MNERIQHMISSLDEEVGISYWTNEDKIKFAELIVKECAQVCRNQPNIFAMKLDRDNCAIAIEEHFGVAFWS